MLNIVRKARIKLSNLFSSFDPKSIIPRHGPGAVSTKEKLWEKFQWTNISSRIEQKYPIDEYYYSSINHVCDELLGIRSLGSVDHSAKVILVPKDSRGPRLISCEPVDFQWIQQGLGRAIVCCVENHELTKFNVFFTDQGPNQRGAKLGSSTGLYATLDLKEASDRVSLELVRLLFPAHLCEYLEACRTTSTQLPDSSILPLGKFAPMGSCLCFPILALTIWSILNAGAPDLNTRESILVYGDDVIVPTAYAEDAIKLLESFGLLVNRDKSCTKGFFRESCGVDAYKGVDVTPVRFRTVWASSRSPDVYDSYFAYARALFNRQCYRTYELIVSSLRHIYGPMPSEYEFPNSPLGLPYTPSLGKLKSRVNKDLQKMEYYVLELESPTIVKEINGWSMLLRYFTEGISPDADFDRAVERIALGKPSISEVSSYTQRKTSKLVRRRR